MTDARKLVADYVAIWNEADPRRREQAVSALWTEDGVHLLQPPQAVRDAAAGLEVQALFEARGHRELLARVARAHEEFVAPGEYSFRLRSGASRLADTVKFQWEMVSRSGEVAGVGTEFMVLAADGRISRDYQFIDT
jgi:hypothetical protein